MNSRNHLLAYHPTNRAVADRLVEQLAASGHRFERLTLPTAKNAAPLSDTLSKATSKVLLLISDNFLKSVATMDGALDALRQMDANRLLPVVVPGVANGIPVETSFARVTNVIQYMNHWQDEYLALRRQKRERTEGSGYDEELLAKVRRVSNEVGEFLRELRNREHPSLEDLERTNFRTFFEFANDLEAIQSFEQPEVTAAAAPEPARPVEATPNVMPSASTPDIAEMIQGASEELLRENEPPAAQNGATDNGYGSESSPEESHPAEESETVLENVATEGAALAAAAEMNIDPAALSLEDLPGATEPVTDPVADEEVIDRVEQMTEAAQASVEETAVDTIDPSAIAAAKEMEPDTVAIEDVIVFEEDLTGNTDETVELMEETTEELEAHEEEPMETLIDEGELSESVRADFAEGRTDEGLEKLRNFLENQPHHVEMRYQYALGLIKHRGDLEASTTQLEQVLAERADHVPSLFLLGEIAELNKNFDRARDYYQRTAQHAEDHPVVNYRLGALLLREFPEAAEEATEQFRRAIKVDKKNADAHYRYAILQNEVHDRHELAEKHFRKTLKHQPNHPFAWYDLAVMFLENNRAEEAAEAYRAAVANNAELETEQNDRAFFQPLETTEAGSEAELPELDENLEIIEAEPEPMEQDPTAGHQPEPDVLPGEDTDAEATPEGPQGEAVADTDDGTETDEETPGGERIADEETEDASPAESEPTPAVSTATEPTTTNAPLPTETTAGIVATAVLAGAATLESADDRNENVDPEEVEDAIFAAAASETDEEDEILDEAEREMEEAAELNEDQVLDENLLDGDDEALLSEWLDDPEPMTSQVPPPSVTPAPEPEDERILPSEEELVHNSEAETDELFERLYEEEGRERQKSKPLAAISTPEGPKTVLITGATSGIGRAAVEIFAQNGYRIIATGRRAGRLEKLWNHLQNELEVDALTLEFDVRNADATRDVLESLPEAWRDIDILINNAGLASGFDPIHRGDLEDWETMIDTNVKGLLYVTRAVSRRMVERGEGMIINIASSAGKQVYANGNVYCATKHAVDALTRAMRLDLTKHGLRVGQVAPGHVEETEFALVRFHGDSERAKIYEDFQPLRASDVADAIYYMATRPPHVNIQDIVMYGQQQAGATTVERTGR